MTKTIDKNRNEFVYVQRTINNNNYWVKKYPRKILKTEIF